MKRASDTFAFLVVCSLGACQATATIHVSPTGDDGNPGSLRAPFRSIARAQVEARRRSAAGSAEPLAVVLHGGTHELEAPLVFTARDPATTYRVAGGESVVVSGGRRITSWRKTDDGRWQAQLPQVKAGKWFFRHLTVGGRRAIRARWPNRDGELRIASVSGGVTRFTFDRPLPAFTAQASEMVVYENWSITRGLVARSDRRQLTTTTPMGWIGHAATTASPGKPVFLEHAREFLDQPGEWFLDRATGVLTYIARPGEDPSGHTVVVAPVLEHLVRIAGTREDPVRNLRFHGIHFEHSNFPLPELGYSEIQAAHYGPRLRGNTWVQPVAVECVFAEDCRFDRCRIAHLGASGIGFGPGCRRNVVAACTIEDVGGNGVVVGWRGVGRRNERLDADWADLADTPAANHVTDCYITRCGQDSTGAVGVFVAFSADTRITHNLVHDLPYTGISVGYRWNTTTTSQERCLVAHNHIHDVMKKMADGGGIYTLGFQPGTVLRDNYIHDVHRSAFAHGGAPNNGFFVDEGSKGFRFERNVVHSTSGEPVRFNNCKREWHEWKDNFFGAESARGRENAAAEVTARAGPRPRCLTSDSGWLPWGRPEGDPRREGHRRHARIEAGPRSVTTDRSP